MTIQDIIDNLSNAKLTVTSIDSYTRFKGIIPEAHPYGFDHVIARRIMELNLVTESGIEIHFVACVQALPEFIPFIDRTNSLIVERLRDVNELSYVPVGTSMVELNEDNIIRFEIPEALQNDADLQFILYDGEHPEIDLQETMVSNILREISKNPDMMKIITNSVQDALGMSL